MVSDSMIITKILLTLPSNLNHFASAWESLSEEQRTLANLTSRLTIEEARTRRKNQRKVRWRQKPVKGNITKAIGLDKEKDQGNVISVEKRTLFEGVQKQGSEAGQRRG